MTLLIPSPLDSSRFGMRIARARLDGSHGQARQLAGEILATACDVAIVRVPAGQPRALQGLERHGLPVMHADTLVHYACDLGRHATPPLRNADIVFERAGPDDLPELGPLVDATFAGYVSHYHANPLFPATDILEGYREWAGAHVAGDGRTLWLARRAGRLVAFAGCVAQGEEAEGILYGVAPEAAGGGLYGDLIRHTQAAAREAGCRRMTVSTQVSNYAVQKVWAREGFHLVQALDTFHVNALLSFGRTAPERDVVFSADDIRRFADATGDRNPIHVDAGAARQAGFAAPIAHGVRCAAELSRVLGMEDPGPGTVIRSLQLAFLRPVLAGHAYRLALRFPLRPTRDAPGLAVATLADPDGAPCMIARADLVLRGRSP